MLEPPTPKPDVLIEEAKTARAVLIEEAKTARAVLIEEAKTARAVREALVLAETEGEEPLL
ncbi:hypothetical protein T484DRAFT_1810206, partial [Baffinella frigidus]